MTVDHGPKTDTEDPKSTLHPYTLTKTKSKENDVGGPTLLEVLELQRSSAVISRPSKSLTAEGTKKESESRESSEPALRLAWLARYDQRIVDIVLWKSKTKSLFTLLWIVTVLALLRTHSAAYVLTASLMSLMVVMMAYVAGSTVLQAATLRTAKHPFASTLAGDITMSTSLQTTISEVFLSLINGSIDFVGRIILVQSFGLTLRAVALLWIIWAHMDDIYLLFIIITCAVFFVPKFYQEHTEECEKVIEVYEENSITGVITAQFKTIEGETTEAGEMRDNGNLETNSKEVLTASITGILIVLLVKYFMTNEQGEIPNLVTYIWSIYRRSPYNGRI